MNEKNLESLLNELMTKDQKKFSDLIEGAANAFKEKYNKEIQIRNREQSQILDGSAIQDYFQSFNQLENWLQNCIDEIRLSIQPILYPLFVYLFLELAFKFRIGEARQFLKLNSPKFPAFKSEIDQLDLLKPPIDTNIPVVSNYIKNKVHIFIPKTTFNFFIHFLNTNHLILILDIFNKYFERSNILSKLDSDSERNRFLLLSLSGEEVEKMNSRTPIYYNKVNRDDFTLKGKGRSKGEKGILSKVGIPFPDQINDQVVMDLPTIKINKTNPPTIGCFTVLNTNNKLNCADMTNEGGIIACGFKDGSIMLWVLDKDITLEITDEKIKSLEEYRDADLKSLITNQNNQKPINDKDKKQKKEDDIKENKELNLSMNNIEQLPNPEFVYELITQRHRQLTLYGHTDAIYSVSISPNLENLISGSYDGTIRLWNLHTKTTIAIYKGHFAPVLSVKFSPISHYFASGGSDRTARLWAINSAGPLRIFVGHLSDVEIVDFHPNSLYLVTAANDKTIRLWALKTGECVRIFVNYSGSGYVDCFCFSNSGKLLAIGAEKGIIIYDLVKMGDPVSIVSNLTNKTITSMSFDNDDNVITVSTEDYKVNFYDVDSILNSEDNLQIDFSKDKKVDLIYSYTTKKTTILSTKFTNTNLMLILGRFDDNDPKIFM